jgi:hypothetical protein
MDLSKLSQNEKLAMYGAAAVVIGGLVGYSYGLTVLAVLAALAALAVIFLPQLSPSTSLPGSRGSLLVVTGGIAGVVLVLAFLLYIGTIFTAFNVRDLFFLLAVAGGILLAWAGWQELQAEGGKLQIGNATTGSTTAATASPAPSTPEPAAPAAPAAPATPTADSAPADTEQRPPA